MKKNLSLFLLFLLTHLLTAYSLTLFFATAVNAASANVKVNCTMRLHAISPYVFGHNTSGMYYRAPMTDPVMINKLKDAGISMLRFPPGASAQRYDFKYNNYKGRDFYRGSTPGSGGWATDVPSLEDELRFCDAVGAVPLIEANTAFDGPNGTGRDIFLRWVGGGDFSAYTGVTTPDTPANRAKYAADMVTHCRSVCQTNSWTYPIYYQLGNEYVWEGQTYKSYIDCYREYTKAMKAVDPNIVIVNAGASVKDLGSIIETEDSHSYFGGGDNLSTYVYAPGKRVDGSFSSGGGNVAGVYNSYAQYLPGVEPKLCDTEWGDNPSDASLLHITEYRGGVYSAHVLYRFVKNNYLIACPWSMWINGSGSDTTFGAPPTQPPHARYFAFVMYKNFGKTLIECYDNAEYTPGVTDYFWDYKDHRDDLLTQASIRDDGNIAIMAINLSPTDSYQSAVSMDNFNMTGSVDVYTMNQSNCDTGGSGPSSAALSGQPNPFTYTFAPFTVTCLIVKGSVIPDTTPPVPIAQVRDGAVAGSDIDNTYSTKVLRANWDKTTDLQSGVSTYWYAVGTTAGGTNVVGWTITKKSTGVVVEGLNLTVGQNYYFTVKAENGSGTQSVATNSDGILVAGVDATAPVMGAVRDGTGSSDIDVIYYPEDQLSANWDAATDAESGIIRYWYAIGTSAGGTDIMDWSSTTARSALKKGVTPTMNSNYYFSVKAENDMGLKNIPVNSDGVFYTRGPMLFQDDFENWTTSKGQWDSANSAAGTVGTATDYKHGGSKALKCADNSTTSGTCYLAKSFAPSSQCFMQFYFYLPAGFLSTFADDEDLYFAKILTASGRTVYLSTGKYSGNSNAKLLCDGSWADEYSDNVIQEGRWYCVEVGAPEVSTSIDIRWWLDGVEQRGLGGQNFGVPSKWTEINLGFVYAPDSAVPTIYMDDLKVAGSYIGTGVTDGTKPSDIASVNDGTGGTDISQTISAGELSANWTQSTDSESGVVKYWYSIGTSPGGTDVAGWTDNGIDRSVTRTGLSLTAGSAYYFSVKSENWVELQSNATNSNGQTVVAVIIPTVISTGSAEIYPNPHSFKEGKPMTFQVKGTDGGEVKIYTISGKLVRKLTIPAGTKSVTWDGKNEDAESIARGVYFYKLVDNAGDTKTGKLAVKK